MQITATQMIVYHSISVTPIWKSFKIVHFEKDSYYVEKFSQL